MSRENVETARRCVIRRFFADAKIKRVRVFADRQEALEAAGLSE